MHFNNKVEVLHSFANKALQSIGLYSLQDKNQKYTAEQVAKFCLQSSLLLLFLLLVSTYKKYIDLPMQNRRQSTFLKNV